MNNWRTKKIKAVAIGAASLATLGVLGVIALLVSYRPVHLQQNNIAGDPQRGRYVAITGDCAACHTTEGGVAYAGGLAIKSPFGQIYSTNITPSKSAGIGNYSLEEFSSAIRNGVRKDGSRLYPAMPYPSYANFSDNDIRDLYAYFMEEVRPVDHKPKPTNLNFPFNQRWGIALWNSAFARPHPPSALPGDDDILKRGAYLVEGPGHCGSCHTPRALTMQEKAMKNGADGTYLSGTTLNGWPAPNLRASGDSTGISTWTKADIIDYLQSGRNSKTAVSGEMSSVIEHSTSQMTASDLNAIATYLKSLKNPEHLEFGHKNSTPEKTESKLSNALELTSGERLYLDNCSACHFVTGRGAPGVFPALAGNAVINDQSALGLVTLILNGAELPSTASRPARLRMPDFGWRLSDSQVADLATFIRSGWGNTGAAVSSDYVKNIRSTTPPPEVTSRPSYIPGTPEN